MDWVEHMERGAGNTEVQGWLDRFFASYYRHRPVNATFIGEHSFDHTLPDFSARGVDDALSDAETLLREAREIDETLLDPIERIDMRLAEGFLRIQQWEFQSRHFQAGNPSLYTGEAIFGVIGLFLTDYGPAKERVEVAVERMHGIRRLLEQGEHNIREAPLAWTQRALRECAGARAFFGRGVDQLGADLPRQQPALRRAADAALAAFDRFQGYLENELSRAARTQVACGGEAFNLLMREGHGLEITSDEIVAYATDEMEKAEQYLVAHADDFGATDWKSALAPLADLHPSTADYLRSYQTVWDASRQLADKKNLLTWPDFPIEYVPQPLWAQEAAPSLYFLFYRAPAAFKRPPVHRYLVTPIDAALPEAEQNRRLRATNDSVIKLNHVVHHGGIGHHVQNWYAYHGPSRIGQVAAVDCASRIAMFCGGTMAEGWACYATTLMDEMGFLTPLEHYAEVHGDVRMCARAIVDVRLHEGKMTLDEAARFYAERTAMSLEASYGEAAKNSMFPGAAMIYLIGRDLILQLREELQRSQGAQFNLKQFHDRFLSFGSIPVALIAGAMRQEAQADGSY